MSSLSADSAVPRKILQGLASAKLSVSAATDLDAFVYHNESLVFRASVSSTTIAELSVEVVIRSQLLAQTAATTRLSAASSISCVQKAQSQSPQANPQRTNTDASSNTPLTGAQLLEQRERELLPSVVRVSSTPAPVAVNGNKLLQDYASSQGFTFQSRPLTSSSVAANSGTNMLTPLTTTPPTSGGQTVAPTFSEDVAQRKKQLTLNPQQGNREP
jgi:hypothetical protein